MSWPMKRIGDICDVIPGFAFKSKDLGEIGIPVIKIGNITENHTIDIDSAQRIPVDLVSEKHKKSSLQNGDILIAMTGATAGKVGRIRCLEDQVLLLNQRVAKFSPKAINLDFFWCTVSSDRNRTVFYGLGGGAAQPNMSGAQIESVEIPYPPLAEQDRIASTLTAYDDLIENNRRRIQLLEQTARLLYREWFVHLRFPGHEHVEIIDGVPEGWEEKKVAQVVDTIGGGTPSTRVPEYWDNGDITWFVPKDLTNNDCLVLLDSEKKITEAGLKKSSAKMLPPQTILMTSRASIGYFGLYDGEACTNQGFISIIPKREKLRMYLLFNLLGRKDELVSRAGGTTYREINKTTFKNMTIILPTGQLLEQYEKFAYDIIKQVRILKKYESYLKQARDLLLPRLMNGEIAV